MSTATYRSVHIIEHNGVYSFFLGPQYHEVASLNMTKILIDYYFDLKKN